MAGEFFIGTQTKILLDEFDVTGKVRNYGLSLSRVQKDGQVLGNTAANVKAGLKQWEFSCDGPRDLGAGSIDATLRTLSGRASYTLMLGHDGLTVGDPVEVVKLSTSEQSFQPQGFGELDTFTLAAEGEGGVSFSGFSLHALAQETAGGQAASQNLGALSADQRAYFAVNVTEYTTAFEAKLQSATDEAFTTPNDRITLTFSGVGAQLTRDDTLGAVADTWWRCLWTLTGNATFAAAAAIIDYKLEPA